MDFHSVFATVARALTSWQATASVVIFILSWTAFEWFRFSHQLGPVKRDLSRATNTVTRTSADESTFATEFHSIQKDLGENATLHHAWSEFDEVLLKDGWSDPPKIKNAQSPGDYFHRVSVTSNRINLRYFNTFPNILTGLGILGTFVGLVAGIYLAGEGLGSSDPEQMQSALQELLSGASLAFFTSIAGLSSSIGFNIFEKRSLHRLDGAIFRFVDALDARLERVTVESLASEQLDQSRQQTRTLEAFSSELAWQIADEMGKKFSSDLGPILEKLIAAVEGMREQRKDDATALSERMLFEFQRSLTGSAGKELTALGQTLELLNDKLSAQISTMASHQEATRAENDRSLAALSHSFSQNNETFQAEMGRAINRLSATLGSAVHEVARELREAGQETGTRLTEMATRLKTTIDSINETIQSSARAAEQHREIAHLNQQTLGVMKEAGENFGQLVEPIGQSTQAIQASATALDGTAAKIDTAQAEIVKSIVHIESIQTQLGDVWQRYEARFSAVDASLAKVFEELQSGLSQYTGTVREFVKGLDSHTSEITQNIAGAVGEMNETLEELQETLSSALPTA